MHRFVCVFFLCLLARSLMWLTPAAEAQTSPNVWTWHNDNNRTGWQQNETILSQNSVSQTKFGKVFQLNVQGAVFAQPLALYGVQNESGCSTTCNVVFVATEQDILYAFNADYTGTTTPSPLWRPIDLAGAVNGTYLNCTNNLISPCAVGVINPDVGVTGTPVIDVNAGILYVATMVYFSANSTEEYYLHAVDYKAGKVLASIEINPTFPGSVPIAECGTSNGTGSIGFNASAHYQRSGLLLLNVGTSNKVFVAFAPSGDESANGWLLAYSYTAGPPPVLSLTTTFATTPYGSGGGIWMASAAPASDGSYIYISTANGTFDVSGVPTTSTDYGDSLLKLDPSTLSVTDYFTPADVFTFNSGAGRCSSDDDFGSGGVMLFPDSFFTGHADLMVTADKESTLYVVDRDHLTNHNSPNLIVQELTTPMPVETRQGYWGSPAYWEWNNNGTTVRAIYYSVDATTADHHDKNAPVPMNMYTLTAQGSGPVPGTPSNSTDTKFCGHGGRPTVSSNGAAITSGIVWAVEDSNGDNPPGATQPDCKGSIKPAILHAYNASNLGNGSSELYNSSGLRSVSYPTNFSTPTVFNGMVYMGTQNNSANGGPGQQATEVDVFGLCGQTGQPSGMP